jgi:hypothetical protein
LNEPIVALFLPRVFTRSVGDFVFVHVYKIAQNWQNARDFFAILQIIFVDGFSNERFILQVGTALA